MPPSPRGPQPAPLPPRCVTVLGPWCSCSCSRPCGLPTHDALTFPALPRRPRCSPPHHTTSTQQGNYMTYLLVIPFMFWNVNTELARATMLVWGIGYYLAAVSKDLLLLPRPHQVCAQAHHCLPQLGSSLPLLVQCRLGCMWPYFAHRPLRSVPTCHSCSTACRTCTTRNLSSACLASRPTLPRWCRCVCCYTLRQRYAARPIGFPVCRRAVAANTVP